MNIAPMRPLLKPWPRTYRVARSLYGRCYPLIERRNEAQIRKLLKAAVDDLDQVWFIQVGANDGLRYDLLHPLIRDDGRWRGVLLEPVHYLYEQLCRNLSFMRDRLTFKQLAASDEPGAASFYYLPDSLTAVDGHSLPEHRHGLGSFDAKHIVRHFGPGVSPHIVECTLQTITLKQLCADMDFARVDVLAMDVEGHEAHVLRGFDFEKYQPRAVLFEHRHLRDVQRGEILERLRRQGFAMRTIGPNTLATSKAA